MMEAAGVSPADINMGLTEILLLVLGVLALIGSFIIPESHNKKDLIDMKEQEDKIRELVEKEVKKATFYIEEKTEETVASNTEKTERYMERLSNEKIMAIQEYSDTVLRQINKNHEEAVFLYDMLNNKHIQIKNTAAELNSRVQDVKTEIEHKTKEVITENTDKTAEDIKMTKEVTDNRNPQKPSGTKGNKKYKGRAQNKKTSHQKELIQKENEKTITMEPQLEADSDPGSNKSKILKLHEQGKSNVEIAKSLGLGIGEVKLIIGLFENEE